MFSKQRTSLNERGFASIVVSLVLILILALITIGFAKLARSEQQSALAKQLASQAYYAAESGINDAMQGIKNGSITDQGPTPTPNINTDKCVHSATLVNGILNNSTGVGYTCVTVNLQPFDLVWSGVGDTSTKHIKFATNGALNSLTINWSSGDLQTTPRPSGSTNFDYESNWQAALNPAVLELSITPLGAATAVIDRNTLINNTFTVFLYPSAAPGVNTVTYAPVNLPTTVNGQIVSGNCSAAGNCSSTITGIPGAPGDYYLIKFTNYYDVNTNISVQANGGALRFKDSQVEIDSTGKAKNVLKRIRITHDITPTPPDDPPGSLDVQSICKRFDTSPVAGSTQFDSIYNYMTPDPCVLDANH